MIDRQIPKFWHCSLKKNMHSIFMDGLRRGPDGCVYLAESMNDSAKFLLIRGVPVSDMVFIEIDAAVLDPAKLAYSLDHSPEFFGCEAFTYDADIPARDVRCNMYTAEVPDVKV